MATNAVLARLAVVISASNAEFGKALAQSSSQLNAFQKTFANVSTSLKAVGIGFGLSQILKIGGDIIDVTAQFERFGAILANTLGSQSAAQAALDSIREFAQETPFEVSEITAAYVRWANQGLNPTIDKMTKLGDVASSLGAGFEQTAEAFKDLLVGQTKRIEEIGISATQSGGKIQLSFKGVNLEIDKTTEGVDKALNTFSQLNGVLGTSDQVSQTLGGKISNLKDAYSNLLLTIGNANGSILQESVDLFINIASATTKLVASLSNTNNLLGQIANAFTQNLILPAKALVALINGIGSVNEKLDEQAEFLRTVKTTTDAAFASGNIDAYVKAIGEGALQTAVLAEIQVRQVAAAKAADEARLASIQTLDKLQSKLKELNVEFEATDVTDKKKLSNIAGQILALNTQISKIEELRKKQKEQSEGAAGSLAAYREALKDLNSEFDKTNRNDLTKLRTLAAQIAGTELLIKSLEHLKSLGDNEQTLKPPDTSALFKLDPESVKKKFIQLQKDTVKFITNIKKEFEGLELGGLVSSAFDGIGEAIGGAISGTQNLGKALLGVLGGVLSQFGKMLIGAGVGLIGLKKAFESLNGYVAIAAGVALVALGAAVSGSVKNMGSAIGSSGGSSSGARSSASPVTNTTGQSINFNARFEIEGTKLVAVVKSTEKQNGRLHG